MEFEAFGDLQVFRPRASVEREIRYASEAHLRSRIPVGRYVKKEEINRIVQHQFKFYSDLLNELLPAVASRDFLEFVLNEFETASKIEQLQRTGRLTENEIERWMRLNKTVRRATKYIAERIILLQPDESPAAEKKFLLPIAEKVWICAEEMVDLYVVSDLVHSIYPEHSFLEILPPGKSDYLNQGLLVDNLDIERRIDLDVENRNRFIPDPTFVLDFNEHDKIIGEAVKDSIGVTYLEALQIIAQIIEGSRPPPVGFPIPFIHREILVDTFSNALVHSPGIIERVLTGFTLSKKQMESEGREIWKPKQEYRAYRRAFFECPHPTGQHIAFSKAMAIESLIIMQKDVVFGKLPPEWMSPTVEKSLKKLSNEAGKWFENTVEENLKKIGFQGIKSAKKGIGFADKRIIIPPEVGEIDFVGYSAEEKILLVVECKLVRDSFEPKLFQDDIHEFVNAKKAYVKKFRKKVDWVKDNVSSISEALTSTGIYEADVEASKVAAVMITFIPTIASYFIADYPCVSLTEFILAYENSEEFPYQVGVEIIPG